MNWKNKRYWKRKGAKVIITLLEDIEYANLSIGDVLYLHSHKPGDDDGEYEGWYVTAEREDKEILVVDGDKVWLLEEEYECGEK